MRAYKPAKGIIQKPMRLQLRGEKRKLKPVKINKSKANKYAYN